MGMLYLRLSVRWTMRLLLNRPVKIWLFCAMQILGDWALRPFLQDTIQLVPLGLAMTGMMLRNPLAVSRVLLQVRGCIFQGNERRWQCIRNGVICK